MLRSLFVPFGTAATYSSSKRHANSQGLQGLASALAPDARTRGPLNEILGFIWERVPNTQC